METGWGVKDSAVIEEYTEEMIRVLEIVTIVWKQYTKVIPVITSGREHTINRHMKSKHYINQAFDFRIRNLTQAQKRNCYRAIKKLLGKKYDVILKNDHIHIEYDSNR